MKVLINVYAEQILFWRDANECIIVCGTESLCGAIQPPATGQIPTGTSWVTWKCSNNTKIILYFHAVLRHLNHVTKASLLQCCFILKDNEATQLSVGCMKMEVVKAKAARVKQLTRQLRENVEKLITVKACVFNLDVQVESQDLKKYHNFSFLSGNIPHMGVLSVQILHSTLIDQKSYPFSHKANKNDSGNETCLCNPQKTLCFHPTGIFQLQ